MEGRQDFGESGEKQALLTHSKSVSHGSIERSLGYEAPKKSSNFKCLMSFRSSILVLMC